MIVSDFYHSIHKGTTLWMMSMKISSHLILSFDELGSTNFLEKEDYLIEEVT